MIPLLALDASTLQPGVALTTASGEPIARWQAQAPMRGTADLAPAVERLLKQAGIPVSSLSGVVVGTGPGSYTGVRSSIALARALAYAARKPLAGVPSVAAAALGLLRENLATQKVVVLLDARRGECYRADYARAGEGLITLAPPHLVLQADVAGLVTDSVTLVAWEPVPDPYDVARLGVERLARGGDDPAAVLPLYLKRSHAEIAWEAGVERRRQGRPGGG